MKLKSNLSILILLAGFAAFALGACTGERPVDATERTGTPQASPANRDALTSFAFERRDEFRSQFTAMHTEFAAQLREYEAKNPESGASEEARAAMADVKAAEADFKHKLDALGTANAETWKTARDNVTAAWDRLQAAFGRVHATGVIPPQGL